MLLKLGSSGADVVKLQTALGIVNDGSFGPGTEKAVKEYQTKNGMEADGIVGDATWSKLFPSNSLNTAATNLVELLNLSKLNGVIPASVISQIPDTAAKFGISSRLRLAHFLSQCATESGKFNTVFENLNYSSKGLGTTFKKYFPTVELANAYARQPEKIANRVYGKRLGNGDESTGDGYRYRGRGYIQLTGKSNYEKFTTYIGEDCVANPDLVATKYPLASAAFFFKSNSLWAICDQGSTEAVVTALTHRVNGGENGLTERKHYFAQFWALLK